MRPSFDHYIVNSVLSCCALNMVLRRFLPATSVGPNVRAMFVSKSKLMYGLECQRKLTNFALLLGAAVS
jgi:hypothetical protein